MMKITIYTDGSSRGNPGRGGWGAVILVDRQQTTDNRGYNAEDEVIELGGREDHTTNNRMELMGAIEGLRHVGSSSFFVREEPGSERPTDNDQRLTSIEICTDSQYVKKGMTEWIDGWIAKGWKGSTKKPVLNKELWQDLKKEEDRLKKGGVKVTWKYVPAHVGVVMNERADTIATMCADNDSDLELYRGPKSGYTF